MNLEKVEQLKNEAIEYFESGDLDATINRISKALLLDTSNYELNYNLGQLLYHAKAYELSLFFMRRSLSCNKDSELAKIAIEVVERKIASRKSYDCYGY